jgi:4-amino-4-deoxy-L-arabinose transferase-like glycosyltransferase
MINWNRLTRISFLSLFVAISISIIILAWVPPVSRDALVHHLNVPKLYIEHGDIYEISTMPFSYYPMNLDLIYLIPLYFGNDIVPKLIHFSFALLTAWLIFHYLRRRLNTTYALLGAVFFLSIPIVIKLSITVYVDLGVIFFSTASLLLLLKWIETGFKPKFLILSAGLCGLAMGTKYNGLITFFLLTLFVPFLYSRYSQNKRGGVIRPLGYGMLFFTVALLVFSPWIIRNYHWKGNPVYPLYDNWFRPSVAPSKEIDTDKVEKGGGFSLFTYRTIAHGEPWWQIALLPIRIFFEGKDGSEQYFDGKLNPFLLILPIFAFWRVREGPKSFGREKKMFLVFAILFFAFAFFSTVLRIRYILPILPPLVILSMFGIRNIAESVKVLRSFTGRKIGPSILGLTVILFLAINVLYVVDQFRYVAPFSYLTGDVTRDEYISKYRPEYPAMQYVNNNLPPESRLLFIFLGKRGYYCNKDYIPDTTGLVNRLYQLIKNSNSPYEVWLNLKKMGVTHLIIQTEIFTQWTKNLFNTEKRRLVKDFFLEHGVRVYSKNGVGVFQLIGDS